MNDFAHWTKSSWSIRGLRIDEPWPSGNTVLGMSPFARRREIRRIAAYVQALCLEGGIHVQNQLKAEAFFLRACARKVLDRDNLVAGLKLVLDALKCETLKLNRKPVKQADGSPVLSWGLFRDDAEKWLSWSCSQVHPKHLPQLYGVPSTEPGTYLWVEWRLL